MIKRILFAALLLTVCLSAQAERPAKYWGLSVGEYELEDDNNAITETTNIGLRGGYQFTRFIGAELHAGWESGSTSGALEEPDITYGGAFARLNLPFERVNLYLLLGGAGVEYDQAGSTESESGAAGGVGLELYGSDQAAVTLEYMNYAEGAYDGVSLGFVYHFDWPRLRR